MAFIRHWGMVLLLAWCMVCPPSLAAHTIVVVEGDLVVTADGSVVLVAAVTPGVLAQLANQPRPATKGDLANLMPALRERCLAGMRLRLDGQEFAPAMVSTLDENQGVTWPASTAIASRERLLVIWILVEPVRSDPSVVMTLPEAEELTVAVSVVLRRLAPSPPAETASETPAPVTPPVAAPVQVPERREEAFWSTVWRALVIGFQHIVPAGLDHLLFIGGLFLGAQRFRPMLLQATAFTVAHSVTLALAISGVVGGGDWFSRMVEVAIAMSIAWVAIENLVLRREPGWRRVSLVAVFGLVHGLGFAGALGEAEWPAGRFIPAVIAANIGIEAAQVAVLATLTLGSFWWWQRPAYRRWVVMPGSLAIGLCGLWWTITRLM